MLLVLTILVSSMIGCEAELDLYNLEPNSKVISPDNAISSRNLKEYKLVKDEYRELMGSITHYTDSDNEYAKLLTLNEGSIATLDTKIVDNAVIECSVKQGDTFILSMPNKNPRYYWDIVSEVDRSHLEYVTRFYINFSQETHENVDLANVKIGLDYDARIVYIFKVVGKGNEKLALESRRFIKGEVDDIESKLSISINIE